MSKWLASGTFLLVLLAGAFSPAAAGETVVMETSLGSITLELDTAKAPASVANFLAYADAAYYDGTIFHRVIRDFMIQGGGYTVDLKQKPTQAPIRNEAANGLKNLRGTIAMARTRAVDSATSQFYINHKDNPALDHRAPTADAFGYAVFGKVIKGMEVVDRIAAAPTRAQNMLFQDLPVETVIIKSVRRVKP